MIRRAITDDALDMIEIYNEAISDEVWANCDVIVTDPSKFIASYFFDTAKYSCFVSMTPNGEVNAWGALKRFSARLPDDESIAEVAVYVKRGSRAKGIGIFLLQKLIIHAKNANFYSLIAIVVGKNIQSIRGCKYCGFEETVRMPEIVNFDGKYEDIVWLQMILKKDM